MADTPSNTSLAAPEIDLSGRQLGDFQILRRLGRGAMAEVYLAEQGSLRRQVALKVLRSNLSTDQTYVQRFHNEAQAAASLVHGSIVQIYDVGCIDGTHYIAQEYVQGQNLREYLAKHGPPDARLAVRVMRQVASALVKAGEAGIIHRDIKPENIMITRDGDVKVADFGLARLSGDAAVNLTQVGITMGTPLYMSPEQVEGKALDPRSDIYSFGVTSYHMLTGAPPFRGETALSVAVQHLKTEPKPLAEARQDLPEAVCRIVHRMLAKDPADRYASARELVRDLRSVPMDDDADGPLADTTGLDGVAATSGARVQATARLDELMKTQALVAVRRDQGRRMTIGALAGAFFLGALVAWASREPFLLADAPAADVPPDQGSALRQFTAAQIRITTQEREAWYQSVIAHYPGDDYYTQRAKEELALQYLSSNRRDEAMELFEQLAAPTQLEKRFQAFGLAGQVVVHGIRRDRARAVEAFTALMPLRDLLDDPRMSAMVDYTYEQIQSELNEDARQAFDQWRERQLSDDAPSDE